MLPILIGLGVDYGIQFQSRASGASTIAAAALATATGFLVLLLSPVPMVRGFGLLLVIGVVVAFLVVLIAGSAALALGLKPTQALRYVIVPQAVRRVVPPLLNDFISLQKDVALVSVIGPQEAFRVAQIFAAQDFNYTPLLGAALLYLCVTIPLTRILDLIQDRRIAQQSGVIAL